MFVEPAAGAPGRRLSSLGQALLAVVPFVAVALSLFGHFVIDDAYISMRYARNLAAGHGLVYNLGEYVEGFSNPSWVALLGLVGTLTDDLILGGKLLALLLASGTLLLSWRLTARLVPGRPWLALLPPLFLALDPAFLRWSVALLETPLVAVLAVLLASTWVVEATLAVQVGRSVVWLLLAASRPEGVLFYVASLPLCWGESRPRVGRMEAARWPSALLQHGLFWGGLGLLLLARHAYYGEWVPNTYWAKQGGSVLLPVGMTYAAGFVLPRAVPLLLGLSAGGAAAPGRLRMLVASLLGLYLLFVVYHGGDWMPDHRFLAPLLPLMYVAAVAGLARWSRSPRRWLVVATVVPLMVLTALVVPLAARNYGHAEALGGGVSRMLARAAAPGDAVVLVDIGLIGYHTDLRVIDLAGLIDPVIGRDVTGFDLDYVFAQRPEFVVLRGSMDSERRLWITFLADSRVHADPRFPRDYRLFPHQPQPQRQLLFVRADLFQARLAAAAQTTTRTSQQ